MNGSQLKVVNISIVLYNTSLGDIENILSSLNRVELAYVLYIIDNSPSDTLKEYFQGKENIVYVHNPANPGFGASHNLVFQKSIDENITYHFVVNPDVYFNSDVITAMVEYMNANSKVGMMMPQILNLDGSIQNLPKLLPSPFSLILRKLKAPRFLYNRFIERYELRGVAANRVYKAPVLSGCFTVFRVEALKEIGLYDDRFFMYFEDWDMSRRMYEKYETIYFPQVSVYHGYESGANKSQRLFKIFIDSAKKYFNKWGWFVDKDRDNINKETLNQF
ncbi:glycosyltransferase [Sphingobacterium haloxyli]|uniref:Glycosyltransferase family 2 protein n=1 Tax=Sphingobacterium haloxyli TaxID=2100533 RepID=A0A2S9J1Z1_9SPHI|nr:glycosyltransferase family 2 protein [Sphingobacterium haloxyli]PRD46806.1 glycosyltransferase family 2 protein [Sphingobacterium haloxyli]